MSRGISPVIAVLLLVFLTITMGAATYFWLTKSSSEIITSSEGALVAQEKELYGKVEIVSVWNETTKICFLLRNKSTKNIIYSTEDLENLAVLINNAPYAIETTGLYALLPGEIEKLCVCNESSCGSPYYIYTGGSLTLKVVPPFGKGDEEVFEG